MLSVPDSHVSNTADYLLLRQSGRGVTCVLQSFHRRGFISQFLCLCDQLSGRGSVAHSLSASPCGKEEREHRFTVWHKDLLW